MNQDRNSRRGQTRRALAALLVAGSASAAMAQTEFEWTGAGDGTSFSDAQNWLPQRVPGVLDSVKFDTVGPDTVVLGQSRTVALVSVENHAVTLQSGAFSLSTSGVIVGERSGDAGTLTLASGTVTTSSDLAIIGKFAGSQGLLTVRGGATLTCSDDLLVGDAGSGELVVESGADVTTPLLFVADEPGSEGSLTVRGALTVQTAALLGNGGHGVVEVRDGGRIVCSTGFKIGDNPGGQGSVAVVGTGSTLSAEFASTVGNLGAGSLNVRAGGSVTTRGLTVGDDADGSVTVRGATAKLTDTVGVRVGNNDTSSGSLTLELGGRVFAPVVEITDFGTLQGEGSINGSLRNDGVVRPGNGVGILAVTSTYQQFGDLEVELAGPDAGTGHDRLDVAGAVTLGGVLRVSLTNGYNPSSGEYVIVQGGSVSGTFNAVSLPPDFSIAYEPGRVVLTIGSGCAADFNGDGAVNTVDVLAFLNAWSSGDPSADMNDDGNVNTQDVIVFLNLWTAGC